MRLPTLVLLAGLLACGPTVVIPGGRLSGPVEPAPPDWAFSDSVETVQLETRPDSPYSVNIWGVGLGDRFMVASASADNRWARYLEEDPRVRLRVGEAVYELRAERSEDPVDRAAFLEGVKRKYEWEPDAEQSTQAVLYVLRPR